MPGRPGTDRVGKTFHAGALGLWVWRARPPLRAAGWSLEGSERFPEEDVAEGRAHYSAGPLGALSYRAVPLRASCCEPGSSR